MTDWLHGNVSCRGVMSSLRSAPDIPLLVTSPTTSSERRVNPSWTVSQFKARLEPITGIPATSQRLVLRGTAPSGEHTLIAAADEDSVQLGSWGLSAYAEVTVEDTRPAHLQQTQNLTDPAASNVPKYEMPQEEYEALPSTVLAYKKAHKIGRFAPDASTPSSSIDGVDPSSAISAAEARDEREIASRGIAVGARCRLLPADTDARLGRIAYVGPVQEIPGDPARKWVGVALDEPTGKNDGRVGEGGHRYFECGPKFGAFVRPERVEVGDFQPDNELDSDMEEI